MSRNEEHDSGLEKHFTKSEKLFSVVTNDTRLSKLSLEFSGKHRVARGQLEQGLQMMTFRILEMYCDLVDRRKLEDDKVCRKIKIP